MRQILTHEDLIKYAPLEYTRLKNEFGEDYDLMHKENDMSIRLKDVEGRFKKLRRKLGYTIMGIKHPLLQIEIKLDRWDSKNKKWVLDRIIPGQSYTEQLSEHWYSEMASVTVNMKADGNVERSIPVSTGGWDTRSEGYLNMWNTDTTVSTPTTSNTIGIVMGSGSTEAKLTDFDMESKEVTNWIWDIQLLVIGTPTINGQSIEVAWSRMYRNTTGSAVDITEVGLLGFSEYNGTNDDSFLIERTQFAAFNVGDLETFRCTYTLRVTNS